MELSAQDLADLLRATDIYECAHPGEFVRFYGVRALYLFRHVLLPRERVIALRTKNDREVHVNLPSVTRRKREKRFNLQVPKTFRDATLDALSACLSHLHSHARSSRTATAMWLVELMLLLYPHRVDGLIQVISFDENGQERITAL